MIWAKPGMVLAARGIYNVTADSLLYAQGVPRKSQVTLKTFSTVDNLVSNFTVKESQLQEVTWSGWRWGQVTRLGPFTVYGPSQSAFAVSAWSPLH